ncbi:MAG: triose-phosphate isomerase [Daejeonella sp.]|uniref:triose-phosphate isomerase n=1 Tax=Daejeonella sp. TaxID=2805397 RepID=UPI002736DB0F|nr:triose-phosphate isomerase [Daejeonella sp.]MDP3469086.1 triose-phosphate isomerase [Daejeonella sp.]
MRKSIVAGNWKMNMGLKEGIALFSEISELLKEEVNGDQGVIVCPPFIHISSLAQSLESGDKLQLGAQNCHQSDSGAFTGEVSASMLASAGAAYVIIGHSERRLYFSELNPDLAKKLDVVLKNGIAPIFCIGETLEQRNDGSYFEVIKSQLSEAAFHLAEADFSKLVIAYEPVWAIGTGLTASPEQAQEIHSYIRTLVAEKYNQSLANDLTILYGGSCNPKNASELFAQPDIDGGLIGGASLKARDFVDIIKALDQK